MATGVEKGTLRSARSIGGTSSRAVRALIVQANVVAFTHHEGKVLWSEEATSWA